MKHSIFLMMTCYLTVSLSVYAGNEFLTTHQELTVYNDVKMSHILMIMNSIMKASDDETLFVYLKDLHNLSNHNVIQQYSYLCASIDRSLKDLKKICLLPDYKKNQNFLLESIHSSDVTVQKLMNMQRLSRSHIKNIIITMHSIPHAQALEISLQQLYHALYELKKQISALEVTTQIRAQYIYVTLLFLDVMLSQGMYHIELSMHHKVEQQLLIHQMLCLTERFKHILLSDFSIAKGVL